MSIDRFLKQRAVNLAVGGSYTLPNWYDPQGQLRNFACRTSRVSPFRMMVDVPVTGKIGDQVNSYFGDFGQIKGTIADTVNGCFLLEIEMSPERREKMSDQLTWLERKQKDPTMKDARADARIIPAAPHSTLTLGDGSVHSCFVIDMSVSGVAVSAELQPELGTPLAVGACVGRVVRLLPAGFAVQFVERQKLFNLDSMISRRALKESDEEVLRGPTTPYRPGPQAGDFIEI
jgi:hypothetical protein